LEPVLTGVEVLLLTGVLVTLLTGVAESLSSGVVEDSNSPPSGILGVITLSYSSSTICPLALCLPPIATKFLLTSLAADDVTIDATALCPPPIGTKFLTPLAAGDVTVTDDVVATPFPAELGEGETTLLNSADEVLNSADVLTLKVTSAETRGRGVLSSSRSRSQGEEVAEREGDGEGEGDVLEAEVTDVVTDDTSSFLRPRPG
jgi:hypothetical protein